MENEIKSELNWGAQERVVRIYQKSFSAFMITEFMVA